MLKNSLVFSGEMNNHPCFTIICLDEKRQKSVTLGFLTLWWEEDENVACFNLNENAKLPQKEKRELAYQAMKIQAEMYWEAPQKFKINEIKIKNF